MPGATCWRGSGAGKKDGRKVEDNWELDYDLDRFFDEHWFWRGSYSQKHDAIDNLERQSALGTGPGYQFWDDELGRFDLVAEISRWQLEWRDQPREDFTSYSLEWDYKRLLAGTRLELYSKGNRAGSRHRADRLPARQRIRPALSPEQLGASFVPL